MFLLIIISIIYNDDKINNKDIIIKMNIFLNLFIVHRRKENLLSLRNKKEGNLSYKWRK